MNKAVFVDKDGTLVEDVPYNVNPKKLRLTDGAIEGLRLLRQHGFLIIVVSNQAGIARGYFNEAALKRILTALQERLARHGLRVDGYFFCPHHPDGIVPEYSTACECRKPAPGMIMAAAEQYGIDLTQSWMIGDILDDIEAGHRAGCKTVLINNGNETEWKLSNARLPTLIVNTLQHAAKRIVREPEFV